MQATRTASTMRAHRSNSLSNHSKSKTVTSLDFKRSSKRWLTHASSSGQQATLPIELSTPRAPSIKLCRLTTNHASTLQPVVFLPGTDCTGQSIVPQQSSNVDPCTDCTGQSIVPQLDSMSKAGYDVWTLVIPADNRSGWDELTAVTTSLMEQLIHMWRPSCPSRDPSEEDGWAPAPADYNGAPGPQATTKITLVAESFGGCLAFRLALTSSHLLSRMVVLNAATCFNQSLNGLSSFLSATNVMSLFPEIVYTTAQATLIPLLVDSERTGPEGARLIRAMINMDAAGHMSARKRQAPSSAPPGWSGPNLGGGPLFNLQMHDPAAAINYRVNLMRGGIVTDDSLSMIRVPTLILCSARDRMLPSIEEGARLARNIPGASRIILPDSGHGALLERSVSLVALMQQAGFSTSHTDVDSSGLPSTSGPSSSNGSRPAAASAQMPLGGGGSYRSSPEAGGQGQRQETSQGATSSAPPPKAGAAKGNSSSSWDAWTQRLGAWRDLVSPMVVGAENLPVAGTPEFDRPMLFVGNHGLMGVYDTPLLMYELYIRGYSVRALAHPGHWNNPMGGLIESLGGVKASPMAAFRLLKNKEKVLLFPGGAREVVKKQGEHYQLLWKDTPDFVRLATKCKALIVPFAATPPLSVIMETDEQVDHPILGPIVRDILHWVDPKLPQ
eukprot:gene21423-28387_t